MSSPTERARAPWRRFSKAIAILAGVSLGLGAAIVIPTAAQAAQHDAVIPGSMVLTADDPTKPLTVGMPFKLTADWAVPAGAVGGDTFVLDIPVPVYATVGDFELKDAAGNVVGTCVARLNVQPAPNPTPPLVKCTLSDYVNGKTDVGGSLFFWMKSFDEVTETTININTGSVTTPVDLPGDGGIGPIKGWVPEKPQKSGWMHDQKKDQLVWNIVIPPASLGGLSIPLTDTYSAGQTLQVSSLKVGLVDNTILAAGNVDWYNVPTRLNEGTTAGTYSIDLKPATNQFVLTINEPVVDTTKTYHIFYITKLDNPGVDGQIYSNSITGDGIQFSSTPVTIAGAGGNGSGVTPGKFSVAKSVTGTAAGQVPAATNFTVNYSYETPGKPGVTTGTLTVAKDGTATSPDIPAGSLVTVSEATPTGIPGTSWGTPVFSGTGVTVAADGLSATFKIGTGATLAVALENPVSAQSGGFSIAKKVTGDQAAIDLAAAANYTVDYSYMINGVLSAGSFTLADGASDELSELPVGTIVTLTEKAPAAIPGVTYGKAVFLGDGVTATATGATLTIAAGTVVAVALENPVTINTGGFSVAKTVTGEDAALALADGASFTVNYSYTANGSLVTGTFTLTDGARDSLDGLPFGTVVTLTEATPTAIPGIEFGTPVFSGDGVTVDGTTATITIGDGTTVGVALENPVTVTTGGFSITKIVTGDQGAIELAEAAGAKYLVDYSYTVDSEDVTGSFSLLDGAIDQVNNLPFGTVVTLTETEPTTVPGVV